MKSVAELREIAHRARHYKDSHHSLPVVKFHKYRCDEVEGTISISYQDISEVFDALADFREERHDLGCP
jgi:hypothetical protein